MEFSLESVREFKGKKHPSLPDLMLLYRMLDRLKRSDEADEGAQSLSAIAEELGMGKRQQLYKKLRELCDRIGVEDVFESRQGQGTRITARGSALHGELATLLDSYLKLTSDDWSDGLPVTIRIGTTNVIRTRVLPSLRRLFYERLAQLRKQGERLPRVRIETNDDEPLNLLDRLRTTSDFDFVVTMLGEEFKTDDLLIDRKADSVGLNQCLLCRYDHDFTARRQNFEDNGFDWSLLADETIIRPSKANQMPNYPRKRVPNAAHRFIDVKTYLEAHQHVYDSNAVAFSHLELLNEDERKYVTAIDLSVGPKRLPRTNLCLLHPHKPRKGQSEYHGRVCEVFRDVVRARMAAHDLRYDHARELRKQLSRFPYAYHTSQYRDDSGQLHHTWFRATISLHVSPARSGTEVVHEEPFILQGRHHVLAPSGEFVDFPVFGRIVLSHKTDDPSSNQYHLLWYETEPGVAYGGVSIVFDQRKLAESRALVGGWLGRSSWDDEFLPTAGAIMLHTRKDATVAQLNKLVKEQRGKNEALDLRPEYTRILGKRVTG